MGVIDQIRKSREMTFISNDLHMMNIVALSSIRPFEEMQVESATEELSNSREPTCLKLWHNDIRSCW